MSVSRSHRSSVGMPIRVFHDYKFILLFVLEYALPPKCVCFILDHRHLFCVDLGTLIFKSILSKFTYQAFSQNNLSS
jgi:hypothetical protein